VSVGQVYFDYKPANLLLENNELFLIDPPDLLWQGVHLWDFSRFHGDMRRLLWRLSLRRPSMTTQKERARLARQKMPHLGHWPVGIPRVNFTTLPLLEIEKRWLFRQLERERT
jgi:hypothetical protein